MAAPMGLSLRRALRGARLGLRGATSSSSSGAAGRSRLYEHVREGNSARPRLDMEALSARPRQAELELEQRKGPLGPHHLGEIVRMGGAWERVGGACDSSCETPFAGGGACKWAGPMGQLPNYEALRTQGREIRRRLNVLRQKEAELDEKYYLKALKLPNRTHPDVVRRRGGALCLGEKRDDRLAYHVPLSLALHPPRLLADAFFLSRLPPFSPATSLLSGCVPVSPSRVNPFPSPQEGCGMLPDTTSSQLYNIDPSRFEDLSLAGTSEVGIAGYFMDHAVKLEDMPVRTVCASTCYRAETDTGKEPWGLYRVHQFTKVEMFGVTAAESGDESEALLEEFLALQKEIFSELGLHYKVLDMPTQELGLPAYRKYDIEAWMPGRDQYGEISSASNCTDYQSRRLNIMYHDQAGELRYTHTVSPRQRPWVEKGTDLVARAGLLERPS
uniref:serine--tRNA ligase n=1 Tax=Sphenodon punctatus TaxID=8508 RepID=A0A8D0GCD2_SPHPU